MRWLVLGMVVLLPVGRAECAPTTASVSVWAALGTSEGRETPSFEPALEAIRKAVADLPYDTYRKVAVSRTTAPFGEETKVKLDEKYTLVLEPLSRTEQGHLRMEIRITAPPRKKGEARVNLLSTGVVLKPGNQLKLRGLHTDAGELIIVLQAAACPPPCRPSAISPEGSPLTGRSLLPASSPCR